MFSSTCPFVRDYWHCVTGLLLSLLFLSLVQDKEAAAAVAQVPLVLAQAAQLAVAWTLQTMPVVEVAQICWALAAAG
jgi:hypothetical protein